MNLKPRDDVMLRCGPTNGRHPQALPLVSNEEVERMLAQTTCGVCGARGHMTRVCPRREAQVRIKSALNAARRATLAPSAATEGEHNNGSVLLRRTGVNS